ncbi:MAG: hypothetical protein Kow0025_09970 [Thermodesulfovibrionales bacterium]
MHGLEAVPHLGQGAADDHAHGVIEVGPLHLFFYVYLRSNHVKAPPYAASKKLIGVLVNSHYFSILPALKSKRAAARQRAKKAPPASPAEPRGPAGREARDGPDK